MATFEYNQQELIALLEQQVISDIKLYYNRKLAKWLVFAYTNDQHTVNLHPARGSEPRRFASADTALSVIRVMCTAADPDETTWPQIIVTL